MDWILQKMAEFDKFLFLFFTKSSGFSRLCDVEIGGELDAVCMEILLFVDIPNLKYHKFLV